MAFYQFKKTQYIETSSNELWNFIASPANLKKITPAYMQFDILSSEIPAKMYQGMIIAYRVRPIPLFNTLWVTEITHIEPGIYFVDEQRKGPYTMWHHEHFIEPTEHGMRMTDIVSYIPPFGILGKLANFLFISRQLKKIFQYREKAIENIFKKA